MVLITFGGGGGGGGEASYSAMNIIAYYRSTHCVGVWGSIPQEIF